MTNNITCGEALKANLALLLLLITTLPIPHVPAQRRAGRPTPASTQQGAYDRAYGIYNLAGTLSPTFSNLSELEIILSPRTAPRNGVGLGSGIECKISVDEMLARPKRTVTRDIDGRPMTLILDRESREYPATELSITADVLSFTTAEVGGTSFRFNGRFTNARPTRRQSNPVVLEGVLEKLVGGQVAAEQRLRFTKFWD